MCRPHTATRSASTHLAASRRGRGRRGWRTPPWRISARRSVAPTATQLRSAILVRRRTWPSSGALLRTPGRSAALACLRPGRPHRARIRGTGGAGGPPPLAAARGLPQAGGPAQRDDPRPPWVPDESREKDASTDPGLIAAWEPGRSEARAGAAPARDRRWPAMLGHTDPTMTLAVYAQVVRNGRRSARSRRRLDALDGAPTGTSAILTVPQTPAEVAARTRKGPHLQGFRGKPSDGLEPSTPSLPWKSFGGKKAAICRHFRGAPAGAIERTLRTFSVPVFRWCSSGLWQENATGAPRAREPPPGHR